MQDNYSTYIQDSKRLLEMLENRSIDHFEFVLAAILLKQTVLFKKKSDGISLSQWMQRSGLSKSKITLTLKSLQKKKVFKKQRQNSPKRGYSYSRYTLTLAPEKDKGSTCEGQALVSEKDIQVTDRTSKEREVPLLNPYTKDEIDAYINHLQETEKVENRAGYARKIRDQLEQRDQATIEGLKDWIGQYRERVQAQERKKRQMIALIDDLVLRESQNSFTFRTRAGDEVDMSLHQALVQGRSIIAKFKGKDSHVDIQFYSLSDLESFVKDRKCA